MNIKDLTNSELQIRLQQLNDKFEATKNKIVELCKELDDIDDEYDKVKDEIKNRQNGIF